MVHNLFLDWKIDPYILTLCVNLVVNKKQLNLEGMNANSSHSQLIFKTFFWKFKQKNAQHESHFSFLLVNVPFAN